MTSAPTTIINKHVVKAPTGAEAVRGMNEEVLYYRTQQINAEFMTTIIETRYYISEKGYSWMKRK